jgi:hypothetical protein
MADPFADPQATDLLKLSVGEVDAAGQIFLTTAQGATEVATGLRNAQQASSWQGAAADAYRSNIGQMPGWMHLVHGSYLDVAFYLRSYANQVEPLQHRFTHLKARHDALTAQLGTAKGNAEQADGTFKGMSAMPSFKPNSAAARRASAAASTAEGAVTRIHGEITSVETQGTTVLTEFKTLLDTTSSRITSSAGTAPTPPHESFFDTALGDIWGGLKDVGKFGWGVVKDMGDSIYNLPSATINMVKDPSAKNIGTFLSDATTTAAAVAMIVAPLAAPELAETVVAEDGGDAAAKQAAETEAERLAAEGENPTEVKAGVKKWLEENTHNSTTAGQIRDGALKTTKYGGGAGTINDVAQGKDEEALVNLALTTVAPGDAVAGKVGANEAQVGDAEETYYRAKVADNVSKGFTQQQAEELTFGDETPDWYNEPAEGKVPSLSQAKAELAQKEYKYNRGGLQVGTIADKGAEKLTSPPDSSGHHRAQTAGATG